VEFKFFGNPEQLGRKGNVEYLGRLNEKQMETLISESSCLMRMLPHDGLSISVEEFLCAGRRVITNIPHIKGAFNAKLDIDATIEEINKVKKFKEPDEANAKYWRSKLSHKKYKKFFDNLLAYDPKDYWEERAICWDDIEQKYNSQLIDEKAVVKQIKKLKPKSILDLGCGNGNWAKVIKKHFPDIEYLGVDISKRMVNLASANVPDADFEVADARNLANFSRKFDLVFAYTCFLHVPQDDMPSVARGLGKVSDKLLMVEPTKEPPPPQGHRQLPPEMITEIEKGNVILHPKAIMIHDYDKYFKITKRIDLKQRNLMVADL